MIVKWIKTHVCNLVAYAKPKPLGKYLFHWNDLRISTSCSTACRQKINTTWSIWKTWKLCVAAWRVCIHSGKVHLWCQRLAPGKAVGHKQTHWASCEPRGPEPAQWWWCSFLRQEGWEWCCKQRIVVANETIYWFYSASKGHLVQSSAATVPTAHPVTTTYLPSGWACRRFMMFSCTLAFVCP